MPNEVTMLRASAVAACRSSLTPVESVAEGDPLAGEPGSDHDQLPLQVGLAS